MLLNYLRAMMAPLTPALGNHLWQSTVCLVLAGLLTLILRKNHARARYGLWLAASVKFLIPFSLLISLGTHMGKSRVIEPAEPGFFLTVQEVSLPFTKGPHTVERRLPPELAADWRYRLLPVVPAVLGVVWLGGFLLVMAGWWRRWRRVVEALDAAEPLKDGRVVEALRRVERRAGVRKPLDVVLSLASLEPGIFGIARPVLVWPAGISEHLQDAHLEAVLAHEVWHVRRRDNLAAAMHMVVEAIFWFHPLVWWLGARLVEERERACDEAVLEIGSEPHVYAESILKTCEFCLESPLACVSGITGAELKKRIVRIVTGRSTDDLSLARKMLLTAIGIALIAGPVVFGLMNAPQVRARAAQTSGEPLPSFEVASIRLNRTVGVVSFINLPPGRFIASGVTTKFLIAFAYNVRDFQLVGEPSWTTSEKYDIEAKVPDSLVEQLQKLPSDQHREKIGLMIQSLLADRFKLGLRHETKQLPVYALVVAQDGPKFQEAKPGDTYPNGIKGFDGRAQGAGSFRAVNGHLTLQGYPISFLSLLLSERLGRTVLDQTGLKGKYDIALKWTPDQPPAAMGQVAVGANPGADSAFPPDSSGPSIFTAIQEQLGLKLETTKGPEEFLVIEHIERPSEN